MRCSWNHISTGCLLMLQSMTLSSQVPFDCMGQVWMLDASDDRIVYLEINEANNAVQITPFIDNLPVNIDAIAYRTYDRLLYGINSQTKEIYSIDAAGNFNLVVKLDLSPDLDHYAMGFDRGGNQLVFIGSKNDKSEQIEIVEFYPPAYRVTRKSTPSGMNISDLEINPLDGLFYGVNQTDTRIVSFNHSTYAFRGLGVPYSGDLFQAVYCNAFGEVFAFGSTAFGVASGLFRIDPTSLENFRLSTGPESYIKDIAACPFNVGIYNEVNPKFSFPCNTVEHTYRIANATGRTLDDLRLESVLPTGFSYEDIIVNPLHGDTEFRDEQFIVKNLSLSPGIKTVKVTATLDNLAGGNYFHQLEIKDLPGHLGNAVVSDNPVTIIRNDATRLEVKELNSDSVFQEYFFCITAPAILDGSPFGSEFEWFDGTEEPQVQVFETGLYEVEALSGCQSVVVVFDVTLASCPYTIDLDLAVVPDSVYPCSIVEYDYIVNNDTGTLHEGIALRDTLPQGLELLGLSINPYNGKEVKGLGERIFHLEDMTIPVGIDTIRYLVRVGEVAPGFYTGQARIENFPVNMGSFRLSDDPSTLDFDSTTLVVLGTDIDSLYVPVVLCSDETLILDGTPYGFEYEWFTGSTESQIQIDRVGTYELKIFTGCEVSFVFFEVEAGEEIAIEIADLFPVLPLGDSILLEPEIVNEGDSLAFYWTDPRDTTLSCLTCLTTYAHPYWDTEYLFYATNFVCSDSVLVNLTVDNTRHLYLPNILSKSALGDDSYYFIQSPEFGVINELSIYDRYGSKIYYSTESDFEKNRWDGRFDYKTLEAGVYIWHANITFLDGLSEDFTGTISLID